MCQTAAVSTRLLARLEHSIKKELKAAAERVGVRPGGDVGYTKKFAQVWLRGSGLAYLSTRPSSAARIDLPLSEIQHNKALQRMALVNSSQRRVGSQCPNDFASQAVLLLEEQTTR